MRPRSVVVEGLTSFSQRVEVSFDATTLCAIVGPTGAGKSSLVDALTLALYGRVARLRGNELAPVISTGSAECRVAVEFEASGGVYRAVRRLRRTKTGATTDEAVLEQLASDGPAVLLAGSAEDLTVEVERLIGLDFDQFTRTVILPQGHFAEVLTARPSDRQKLLGALLGTEIYERVKVAAGVEARAAESAAEQIARQIAQIGPVDAPEVERLAARASALGALEEALVADHTRITALRDAHADARRHADATQVRLERLTAITSPPDDVRELGTLIRDADEAVTKHAQGEAAAAARVDTAERSRAALGDPVMLTEARAGHRRLRELRESAEQAAAEVEAGRADLARLTEEEAARGRSALRAQAALAEATRAHAAAVAAEGLSAGDACPVCDRRLQVAPVRDGGDVAAARAAAEQALRAHTRAAEQCDRAKVDLEQARVRLDAALQAVADAERALADAPGEDVIGARLEAIAEAEQALSAARDEQRGATRDRQAAEQARAALEGRRGAARRRLEALRMAVADSDPPPLVEDDLVGGWEALATWAAAAADDARQAYGRAVAEQERLLAEGTRVRRRMEDACRAAGVDDPGTDPLRTVAAARARAEEAHAGLRRQLELLAGLHADQAKAHEAAQVAGELARLLRADQFSKWLLDEATRHLVVGAGDHLRRLSRGRYELAVDDRGGITVADLSAAGMTRSVRTLSGGETFLASLALALSLADQVTTAAKGPVALESLFVDEGFGALDAETLDVAAGALEQLASGDRLVGVVTHVTDLAERMPTRFEVQRSGGGSTVTKVEV